MSVALAMGVALLIDWIFGEPPARLHPVVGMGRYLGLFSQRLLALKPVSAFAGGALAWLVGALAVGVLAALLEAWAAHWHPIVCAALMGLFLKPLLSWRMLRDEVMAVEAALAVSVESGRQQLARLVSRDTSSLSESEVREVAIETLAENLNDSVVAPLFWFAIAGLPGAAVYRFANTADAMWAYRGRWEWAGKWAAWADDLLSWIPARITAFALHLPSQALRRQAALTPSPNSGWPMAAMALRLGVRLGKPGAYCLNERGLAPTSAHLHRACTLATQALLISATALALLAWSLR